MRTEIEGNSELGGLRKKIHVRVIENKLTGLRDLNKSLDRSREGLLGKDMGIYWDY